MNILVTGQQGMLGQAVERQVQLRGHVLRLCLTSDWEHRAKRIEDFDLVDLLDIDVVINCAGLVSQRPNTSPANFMQTNAYGPQYLAELCDWTHVRLVQMSSDCVFSLPGPHPEAGVLSPRGYYGISKAGGEVLREPHLTVRSSFIGPGPIGLLHDLQTLPRVEASRRLLWSGHTLETVSRLLVVLAERREITGLLHIPGEFISRYELCRRLVDQLHLPVELVERNDFTADRRLLSARWENLDLPRLPSLEAELAELCL